MKKVTIALIMVIASLSANTQGVFYAGKTLYTRYTTASGEWDTIKRSNAGAKITLDKNTVTITAKSPWVIHLDNSTVTITIKNPWIIHLDYGSWGLSSGPTGYFSSGNTSLNLADFISRKNRWDYSSSDTIFHRVDFTSNEWKGYFYSQGIRYDCTYTQTDYKGLGTVVYVWFIAARDEIWEVYYIITK